MITRRFLRQNGRIFAVYGLVIVMVLVGVFFTERFVSERNQFNLLRQMAFLGVVALGQMLVVLTGGIDLSVGSLVRVSVLVSAILMNGETANTPPAILITLLIGAGIGLVHALLINRLNISPFIVTLASYVILRGVALTISTSPIGKASREALTFYDQKIGPFSVLFVLFVILVIALIFVLRRTIFGRYVYAVGGNQEVARLSGIPVQRVRYGVYMLCSLLASVCGLMWLSRMGVGDPVIADGLELTTITAVIIGGTSLFGGRGSVLGTVGGVLVLAILANLMVLLNVQQQYQGLIEGVVIVASIALYNQENKN
ncbi:MAG: ABC transporter permease [Chloroflexi bacterium]|uniref:ABC transporter permease n=1 Tax=Candidatus Flexifilum breve TaxID=3140694 RepID=UPI0031353666|nr:ABC transporter permease [Chloroflexota bacterium]